VANFLNIFLVAAMRSVARKGAILDKIVNRCENCNSLMSKDFLRIWSMRLVGRQWPTEWRRTADYIALPCWPAIQHFWLAWHSARTMVGRRRWWSVVLLWLRSVFEFRVDRTICDKAAHRR